ncbi:carbohydrate esterase family 4 protein [Hypoxylon trugodes]|uniref:carbohydrate esterase family 4 protein n=1 Tax=Hypoxylon trugodes TaxID=326681 RepID=UPI0021978F89|nr:carbohydrate esterase family 4 protein [Hypoxylon trugodes]KAI1393200.1 carbohydrate esterase family 4 protein [Hypoxylon trugodes]
MNRISIFTFIFFVWTAAFCSSAITSQGHQRDYRDLEGYTSHNHSRRYGHKRRRSNDDKPHGASTIDMPRPHVGDYWTEQILDHLDKYDARATFFVTGHNLFLDRRIDDEDSQWPGLLRAIHEAGHQLGSHTWTHKHLENITREDVFDEMIFNEMAFRNVLNLVPTYMRPPYGAWRDENVQSDMQALGYHVVMYDVDTKDYKHNDADGIEESIRVFEDAIARNGTGSYITLSHDIRQWTALKLVPAMLKTITERGYKAVTLGECLNDPWVNWYRYPDN